MYWLTNALKSLLDDRACHISHGNSVSGHFVFHVFMLSHVLHLHIMQCTVRADAALPNEPAVADADPAAASLSGRLFAFVKRYGLRDGPSIVFSISYAVLFILSLVTLWHTYFGSVVPPLSSRARRSLAADADPPAVLWSVLLCVCCVCAAVSIRCVRCCTAREWLCWRSGF
jgi:hypothetical protein